MLRKHWSEYNPSERDDANRLGVLYGTLQNHLHFHPVMDDFLTVLSNAFEAEFRHCESGTYPPAGHGYPRLDEE